MLCTWRQHSTLLHICAIWTQRNEASVCKTVTCQNHIDRCDRNKMPKLQGAAYTCTYQLDYEPRSQTRFQALDTSNLNISQNIVYTKELCATHARTLLWSRPCSNSVMRVCQRPTLCKAMYGQKHLGGFWQVKDFEMFSCGSSAVTNGRTSPGATANLWCCLKSMPKIPACKMDRLSESGEMMTILAPDHWVSQIDITYNSKQ